jgi:hypothetical protein
MEKKIAAGMSEIRVTVAKTELKTAFIWFFLVPHPTHSWTLDRNSHTDTHGVLNAKVNNSPRPQQ